MSDRYGYDVLKMNPHHTKRRTSTPIPAERGLVVEDVESGFVGAVVRLEKRGGMHVVELEDRRGRRRGFPLGAGFWVDGNPVTLVLPKASKSSIYAPARTRDTGGPPSVTGRRLTNSGSVAVEQQRARLAQASRIWVEGRHDAELVEHVWGDDLRVEGIVVELLEGVDHLHEVLRDFAPTPTRRAGILVDHMIEGSKESRIAAQVLREFSWDAVRIEGHPFIDIWQAVKPARVGVKDWPTVERGRDIKVGTLAALGWPHSSQADIAAGWKRILRSVRDYRDLQPELLGRVESLIDFVTAPSITS
ncbi:MAG: DUF3097 domain-containing protein [Actinomycetaceae bacterium]|nr:DUF3097 domain-containing protein [Actinomycetaceae bacterium]